MDLNPINQLSLFVIVGVGVIFTATYFVLRRTFFLPVIEVMEQRFDRIEASRTVRYEAADVSRHAETEAADIAEAARTKSDAILAGARASVEKERQERLEAARAQVARALDDGRREIVAARDAELATLREETAVCVTIACDKLLHGTDPHVIESVVDRLVAKRLH
jgi:F0F1-type ATP synthase membrane subunit b/b'